jgi:hypothetical protein
MLKLSDEALGSIMLALQKSLMEQSDIVPELFVMNPPIVKFKEEDEDDHPIGSLD